MDWNKAIKEYPSCVEGKCMVSSNNNDCMDSVKEGACPIERLRKKTQ